MSKIIKFLDKLVEFPLRWSADIGGTPSNITDLTRDPGTVYQAGTANKAEYFNSIQENGVYSVNSTFGTAGSVTTYTITDFLTEGTFTIYEGFKLSMKSSGSNIGTTKIDLLGTVYDVKFASGGSYIDTLNDDIKTNEVVILEYRNGVFVLLGGQFLSKGVGLSEDYNTAKKLEDKIEDLSKITRVIMKADKTNDFFINDLNLSFTDVNVLSVVPGTYYVEVNYKTFSTAFGVCVYNTDNAGTSRENLEIFEGFGLVKESVIDGHITTTTGKIRICPATLIGDSNTRSTISVERLQDRYEDWLVTIRRVK